MRLATLSLLCMSLLTACASPNPTRSFEGAPNRSALAIHGGAGVIDKDTPAEKKAQYVQGLSIALRAGQEGLARGDSALDVCERVVRILEDNPLFNAGKGAVYTENERHELDASIMDGSTLACGAIAGVQTIKNPISLARLVMERSGHVLLVGDGAEAFASQMQPLPEAAGRIERVPNSYFDTPARHEALRKKLEERGSQLPPSLTDRTPDYRGTVGCVALDIRGNLAAATSTGGMTAKRWGRVGDSPIIGAGCYADNRTCAVSCTGTGEEFIRHGVARTIANLIEMRGLSARDAATEVVHRRLQPDDGGVIIVSRTGEIAMVFSTIGMFRGAADSQGRFDVSIWSDTEAITKP
jgi:L-asparaginase / beta-aspartyl-peptidase